MKQFVLILVFLCCLCARAEVRLPQFFADGMVLQQQSEVRLWGWCDKIGGGTPGMTVVVTTSWDGRRYEAKPDYHFHVAPLPAMLLLIPQRSVRKEIVQDHRGMDGVCIHSP